MKKYTVDATITIKGKVANVYAYTRKGAMKKVAVMKHKKLLENLLIANNKDVDVKSTDCLLVSMDAQEVLDAEMSLEEEEALVVAREDEAYDLPKADTLSLEAIDELRKNLKDEIKEHNKLKAKKEKEYKKQEKIEKAEAKKVAAAQKKLDHEKAAYEKQLANEKKAKQKEMAKKVKAGFKKLQKKTKEEKKLIATPTPAVVEPVKPTVEITDEIVEKAISGVKEYKVSTKAVESVVKPEVKAVAKPVVKVEEDDESGWGYGL